MIASLLVLLLCLLYQFYLQWDELSEGEDVMDYVMLTALEIAAVAVCLFYLR